MTSFGFDDEAILALRRAVREPGESASDGATPPGLRSQTLSVVVAGLTQRVALAPDELVKGYVRLMRILLDEQARLPGRIIAGLAGVPGSGKSTLAAVLAELWRRVGLGPELAVVGMDGWHLTNAELDRRTFTMPDGTTLLLRRRKGSPPSFDAEALAQTLHKIRNTNDDVALPVYDRSIHEPVPDAEVVSRLAKIVLVEGNYLLLNDEPWASVLRQIDVPLWLDADPAVCQRGLIDRHVAGGMPRDRAEDKYDENDRPNAEIALAGRGNARWFIQADKTRRLTGVVPAR